MTAELHRHWRLDNPPTYDPAFNALGIPLAIPGDPPPNFSALTYAELAAEFEKKHPPGTNVEDWITEKLAQEFHDDLMERMIRLEGLDDPNTVLLNLVQLGLDIGGVFDPTPITDGVSAVISLLRLQISDAAISTVSMLPLLGDNAKWLKVPHYIETLATAGYLLATKYPQFAFVAAAVSERIYHVVSRLVDAEDLPAIWRQPIQKLYYQAAETAKRLRAAATKHADEAIAVKHAPDPNWRQSLPDSKQLGQYLGKQTGDGLDAHHIVAGELKRFDPARKFLDKYQIDINDPANGVLLKGGEGANKNVLPRHHHSDGNSADSVHSKIAVQSLLERLDAATQGIGDWAKERQRVLDALKDIGNQIELGQFP